MSYRIYRVAAAPVLAACLIAPALTVSGCDDSALTCEADVVARVEAFQGAANALVTASAGMKASIATSCFNIATELGQDTPAVDGANTSDEDLKAACDAAAAGISASIEANGEITIAVVGGSCEVNADAQLSCDASCQVDASCQGGDLEARCSPGELSGSCSAECSGSCTVETGSVECAGACNGVCEGECSATSTEGGQCSGTCSGGCTGTCEVVAPSATCEGSCKGECSVAFVAPACEATLTPPSCEVDAECSGGCEAEGNLSASCSPPKITVEGNAELKAILEANLPDILLAVEVQGTLFAESAAYVAETGVAVVTSASQVPACAVQFGADVVAELTASVEASVSVSVSVEASGSVSGST